MHTEMLECALIHYYSFLKRYSMCACVLQNIPLLTFSIVFLAYIEEITNSDNEEIVVFCLPRLPGCNRAVRAR